MALVQRFIIGLVARQVFEKRELMIEVAIEWRLTDGEEAW